MVQHLLKGLNEAQVEAVTQTEGYIRVIAGAGAGKTKTLANRYAYLVDGAGMSPENILCITFTNKAAEEMRSRMKKILQDGVVGPYVSTYHGFCVKVLREDIHHLNYPKNFTILDEEDQQTLLQEVYDDLDITINHYNFKEVFNALQKLKKDMNYVKYLTDPTALDDVVDSELLHTIMKGYLAKQRKYFALDFNDLIYFVLYLFTHHTAVLEKWQERLYYIQVDEFQDSSKSQIKLVHLLSQKHGNLFVVGDPDQAIYGWRGASPRFLVDFDKTYPTTKTIYLLENYRSTPQILNVSNDMIQRNTVRIDKKLFTNNEQGATVSHIHAKNERNEMEQVSAKIKELVTKNGAKYSDIAIIYRAHFISRFVEQGLMAANIPYEMFGGVKFYQRKEIKDTIAFLKMMLGDDEFAFLRTVNLPKRNIGKKRIAYLKQQAGDASLFTTLKRVMHEELFQDTEAQSYVTLIETYRAKLNTTPISELLRQLLDASGYDQMLRLSGDQDRIDNISELLATIVAMEQQQGEHVSLEEYLQTVALMTDKEDKQEKDEVKLMTMHTAKGLEFPYVFLVSFTDGIIPNARSASNLEGLEEERRLAYVGMTRAMKALFISESETSGSANQLKYPSRFVFEVEQRLLQRIGEFSAAILQEVKNAFRIDLTKHTAVETSETPKTKKVVHPIFGEGTIQSETERIYQVDFNGQLRPIQKTFKGLQFLDVN